MKKLFLIPIIFLLLNCEVKVKETNAQSSGFYEVYKKERITIDDMNYMFIYVKDKTSQTGYSVTTINLTKDKLEVELLKKQLAKI